MAKLNYQKPFFGKNKQKIHAHLIYQQQSVAIKIVCVFDELSQFHNPNIFAELWCFSLSAECRAPSQSGSRNCCLIWFSLPNIYRTMVTFDQIKIVFIIKYPFSHDPYRVRLLEKGQLKWATSKFK